MTTAARALVTGSNSVPGVVGTLPWRHPVQKDGGSLPLSGCFSGLNPKISAGDKSEKRSKKEKGGGGIKSSDIKLEMDVLNTARGETEREYCTGYEIISNISPSVEIQFHSS